MASIAMLVHFFIYTRIENSCEECLTNWPLESLMQTVWLFSPKPWKTLGTLDFSWFSWMLIPKNRVIIGGGPSHIKNCLRFDIVSYKTVFKTCIYR